MEIDLSTDAAPYPERTLQLAETMAAIVRTLNHQTKHREALQYPAEADRLIRDISTAIGRLPQLLGQVSAWLSAEQEAGRIEVTDGEHAGQPARALAAAAIRLDEAEAYAGNLQVVLDMAAAVTSTMAASGKDDDDERP